MNITKYAESIIEYARAHGAEKITKNITFQVPKAVKQGQKIRLKGEGKKDAYGRIGDVYLTVKIKDSEYEVIGNNLII